MNKATATPLPGTWPCSRWQIIRTMAGKEWVEIIRDARFRGLAVLALLLMACALIFGVNQTQRTERDRSAAAF